MRKNKCAATASSRRPGWRREILQRFKENPPWPQNKQELDFSVRKSGRDYQAVRYSEASEERFLELMKRTSVVADFPVEQEVLGCVAPLPPAWRERERERGWNSLPIKQEGILPDARELQDLEFEELDRRAAKSFEEEVWNTEFRGCDVAACFEAMVKRKAINRTDRSCLLLESSVQVLEGSTFAYLSNSNTGRPHVDVKGMRKRAAQPPPAAAERAGQEEDDMAATALSAAMNFLVHSVQDGVLLDEWLVSGTSGEHNVLKRPIEVSSIGASPKMASDASITYKDACGRWTRPSCGSGITFLQDCITDPALVPCQAPGHSRTNKAVTPSPEIATSSMVAADNCCPLSDIPLSPAVDNLIFQVIHEWLSPDDQEDLTRRGRQGNLGKGETYVHKEASSIPTFAAAGHPNKQRDEVLTSSLPSRSWTLDELPLKTSHDQPPDLDTVNYLDDLETLK